MTRYIVTCKNEETRTAYGIAALLGERQVDWIDDVAATLEETAALASMLQEHGVAAEHFCDVLQDYFSG